MPKQPNDAAIGFPEGSAKSWFEEKHSGHVHVLDRVKQKASDSKLKRPE